MTTTHTRTKILTAVVGAAIATMAAPALLILSAGTAQAFNPQPDRRDSPIQADRLGSPKRPSLGTAILAARLGSPKRASLGSPVPMFFRRYITESLPVPHIRTVPVVGARKSGTGGAGLACAQQDCSNMRTTHVMGSAP
jgi:hypothetical protein